MLCLLASHPGARFAQENNGLAIIFRAPLRFVPKTHVQQASKLTKSRYGDLSRAERHVRGLWIRHPCRNADRKAT